ncbi:CDK5 regulatory subunit-associated protein 3-like [Tubulanus polymorphus]|uniref:CDK5 regulatory subunit-associated protein 3-like n=1 Tax=Tubulanus polymorphus TaxID=672921 RepID=UPI003DA4C696
MEVDNLPIDIHYNKLLDWLINRRHCLHQWQASAITIREKINNAIQDMPAVEEITKLLQGTYINYFHCLRIVEILKDTEANTKNIFGRYSSQRMKDWNEIVQLYEKDGIYLAEVAQLLTRNVNYEIPSLKKQIAKCKQTHDETIKKEAEYVTLENEFKQKYHAACKQMDIPGVRIKTELMALLNDLPSELDNVVKSTSNLSSAVEYCRSFVQFISGSSNHQSSSFRMLDHLMTKGNTTIYEWKNGEAPRRVEETPLDIEFEDEEEKSDQIDWGTEDLDLGNLESALDNITFEEGAIDFGDGDGGEIDWGDVESVDIQVEDGGDTIDIAVEEEPGVAKGNDALSILDDTETRNLFLDDLYELQAFFHQRLDDLNGHTDTICDIMFQSAPSELQLDVSAVEKMLARIDDVLQLINATKMQHMLTIRSFPRYVHRLAENMKQHMSQAEKYHQMQKLMVEKRDEMREEEKRMEPKVKLIRNKTLELKKQIESEISKKYKNRPVNIMGEINVI